MRYRLNSLPIKTTNHFHINDVEVDLEIPKLQMNQDFEIMGDLTSLEIKKEIKEESLSSKIGFDVSSYLHVFIKIPKGVKVEKPIHLNYHFSKEDSFFAKLQIQYEEDSYCNFIITMDSLDEEKHFCYLVEETTSSKKSSGNISFINHLNSKSFSFYAVLNHVMEHANIVHSIIDLGGATRLYNVYSDLLEEYASNRLNTIYIGKEDTLLDFQYYLKNIGRETHNQMQVEGAIGDRCHKNFRGTIDFIKGCSQSVGEEIENCVLLSDECISRSLPQMLCEEEDVVGTHGVSSGKVDEDKLFYLMSRGYSQKEAEKLLILGNFMKILEDIPEEETRNKILEQIEKEI